MNNKLKHIAIVGGGTAGWLTAGILAAEHHSLHKKGVKVSLIESPEVKTVGVGEGTWPTMRATLQKIGISEQEFVSCCDASFKQASKFVNWVNGDDSYYHPFVAPHGFGHCNIVKYWQQSSPETNFSEAVSFQSQLCEYKLAPKQVSTPEYAAVANYGYHLNAGKFAELLRKHCTNRLGVKHVSDHVTAVNGDVDSNIESLSTKLNGDISADLFIDCSGLNSILLAQHYNIGFIDKADVLFNDRALAVHVPYDVNNNDIDSNTISTALANGWVWDIALPSRRGVGYVYSSKYQSEADAIAELKQYIAKTTSMPQLDNVEFKKIQIRPGYREKFWHKNCVAVGMAAGFLEPLEASALALVELSANMISKELPTELSIMDLTEERFNKRFHYRWERIVEFLKLHYVLSKRKDSQYWLDNRNANTIPDRLQKQLRLWQFQAPSYNDFTEIEEIFPPASYQYILYGMGFITEQQGFSSTLDALPLAEKFYNENIALVNKYLGGLPKNRELITQIINNYKKIQS